MKTIVLASQSERRIEMFKRHGFDPIVMPAYIDEEVPEKDAKGELVTPEGAAAGLATLKAAQIAKLLIMSEEEGAADCPIFVNRTLAEGGDIIIFGFDTIVVFEGEIYGKPEDQEEAFNVLSKLSGNCHKVITGVCVFNLLGGKEGSINHCSFTDTTKIWLKDIDAEELEAYVRTDEPYDKAGGYGIQGTFAKYIDHVDGDENNVIGLPWRKIEKYLEV